MRLFHHLLPAALLLLPLAAAADIGAGEIYRSGFNEHLHIDLPSVRIDESPDSAVQVLQGDPHNTRVRMIRGQSEVHVDPYAGRTVFETPSGIADLSAPGRYVLTLYNNGAVNIRVLAGRAHFDDGRRTSELYAGDVRSLGGREVVYVSPPPPPERVYFAPPPPPPVFYRPRPVAVEVPLFGFRGHRDRDRDRHDWERRYNRHDWDRRYEHRDWGRHYD